MLHPHVYVRRGSQTTLLLVTCKDTSTEIQRVLKLRFREIFIGIRTSLNN